MPPASISQQLRITGVLVIALAILSSCGDGSGGRESADPVVVDFPIAYVKRPLPWDRDAPTELLSQDLLEPAAFNPGAALYVRDRAAPGAGEINVTARAWPAGEAYDVKDLDVSPDGEKLIFAMRGPEDPDLDDDEQPKWDIWEYELATDTLRRVLTSETIAQQNHDVDPHYLADGRIVFSSDRQQRTRSILLDDGKPQYGGLHEDNLGNGDEPAFVLHRMDADGSDLEQITFNQSHDLHASMLRDGRILFLRWDRWGNDKLSLYTVNPDGSRLEPYYGFHSQTTGAGDSPGVFSQPRQTADGRILSLLRPRETSTFGGDMVLIDGENFTEINQAVFANRGAEGPGQVSASLLEVRTDEAISPHGYFSSAFPLDDGTGRLLVGWSQCRLRNPATPETVLPCTERNLADPEAEEAEPAYGIWVYDPAEGTQLPVIPAEEQVLYSDVVAMAARSRPEYIQDTAVRADPVLLDEQLAVVHIRSVYDFDGEDRSPNGIEAIRDPAQTNWSQRPARYLRVLKAVSIPPRQLLDFDGNAFGVNGTGQSMREILGYVPIEPDGSVQFKVPADVAFSFAVVDARGRRLPGFGRHQNWLQLRPGEVLECHGCHTADSELPHGRLDAQAPSINTGAPTAGAFPNTRLAAEMGETMAQAYSRIHGLRTPSVDMVFSDEWSTGPDPADSFSYRYADLNPILEHPVSQGCEPWTGACRVTVNYLQHIQPLWELTRTNGAGEDRTCVNCHQPSQVDGTAVLPPGQLDLRAVPSDQNTLRVTSYQELLSEDNLQEVNGEGNIVDALQPRLDGNGNPVLDPDGNPLFDPIEIAPPMSASGAANSQDIADSSVASGNDFFSWFASGASHEGDLSEAELKLISEWLDIGAQYYNDPFRAPAN